MQPLKMGKVGKPHGRNPSPKRVKNKYVEKKTKRGDLNKTPQGKLPLEIAQETLSKP
jgi:hypothetical protein